VFWTPITWVDHYLAFKVVVADVRLDEIPPNRPEDIPYFLPGVKWSRIKSEETKSSLGKQHSTTAPSRPILGRPKNTPSHLMP
jgi:hypothetical protein